jgi:hypothetical protein
MSNHHQQAPICSPSLNDCMARRVPAKPFSIDALAHKLREVLDS